MTRSDSSESADLLESLQESIRLTEEGRWAEAFELLMEAETHHPTDPTLLCALGVTATEVDVGGMAYDYFRRCLAEDPVDPAVLVPLGVGLARFDDPEAERVLRLASISSPANVDARLHYGAYLAREGQLELALRELREARRLEAGEPRVHRELAIAFLLAGRADEAGDEIAAGLALDPESGDLHLLSGLAQVQSGRLEEAAEDLHRAALGLDAEGEVQLAAALACASQEWWDQAWDLLARADFAANAVDPILQREVEEALESGQEASSALLREGLAPSMLRERLLEHL